MLGEHNKKVILHGLEPFEYEHKDEKELIKSLNGNAIINKAFDIASEYGIERILTMQHTGSYIEVTESNLSDIYNVFNSACRILDIADKPRLYIQNDYDINAFASGINNPVIVITSGAIEKLTKQELLSMMGHELGHIKSKHIKYNLLQMALPFIKNLIPGIGGLLTEGAMILLYKFNRIAELTADRAGLLACQNIEAITTKFIKQSGYPVSHYDSIDINEFAKQYNDFQEINEKTYTKIVNVFTMLHASHPWTVNRAKEINNWHSSGEYEAILARRIREIEGK
jgi:Zn-dependent protease with chaperone function